MKDAAKNVIKDLIKERWGLDVEQFDLLSKLGNKMDVASVTIGDSVIPVFKPGDHAELDAYMGIHGVPNSSDVQDLLLNIPGVTFYDDAKLDLGQNVEFDKTKFAAYADSVTISKMLLLTENPVDGSTVGAGGLTELMRNQLAQIGSPYATTYDFSKLNLVGAHGGNVLTTTLQKPGVVLDHVETQKLGLDGVTMPVDHTASFPSDARGRGCAFDGSQNWRNDSFTTTTALFPHQYRYQRLGAGGVYRHCAGGPESSRAGDLAVERLDLGGRPGDTGHCRSLRDTARPRPVRSIASTMEIRSSRRRD